jgi:predicted flap endonuclease-1-like 5' DNA nuclease
MGYKIVEIEGIGPAMAELLSKAGIETTDALLDGCGDPSGRKAVAKTSGLSEKQLLKWANMADLMRVKGVGSEYSELLEAAGVDTVKELKTRNAGNLAVKMAEVNVLKKLTRTVPSESVVQGWVDQAAGLPAKIKY